MGEKDSLASHKSYFISDLNTKKFLRANSSLNPSY